MCSPPPSGPTRLTSELAVLTVQLVSALDGAEPRGALTPYAQAYDAIEMFAGAANGVNADDPGSLRTYLGNANYQGLLGSYNFISSAHAGLDESQETALRLTTLSNGVFLRPASG